MSDQPRVPPPGWPEGIPPPIPGIPPTLPDGPPLLPPEDAPDGTPPDLPLDPPAETPPQRATREGPVRAGLIRRGGQR